MNDIYRSLLFLGMNRIFLIFICLMFFASVQAQKTDWVYVKKNSKILCEIKQLEFGKLRVKGYEMGTVRIEWDAIDSIYSEKQFLIRLEDGTILESRLDSSWYSNYNYPWKSIVEIIPLKDKILSRIEGEVDLGFNYAKSSNILQLNIYGDLTYRNHKNTIGLYFNNISTLDRDDEGDSKTMKKDIDVLDDYSLPGNYLIRSILGIEQNNESGLDGRIYIGGGLGKEFLHSQKAWLLFGVGARANREWSTNDLNEGYNAEGAFMLEFKRFSFDFPNIDISSSLSILPSLTDWGRVRADVDVKAKIEVIEDFFFSVRYYYTLDNEPVDVSAEKSDWGLTTSVGYNF